MDSVQPNKHPIKLEPCNSSNSGHRSLISRSESDEENAIDGYLGNFLCLTDDDLSSIEIVGLSNANSEFSQLVIRLDECRNTSA